MGVLGNIASDTAEGAASGAGTGAIGGPIGAGWGAVIGAGIGLVGGVINSLQQKSNINTQMQNQEKLAMLQENEQEQLWQRTGPEAQVAQYERAGLNPALIYAKGGAMGETGAGINTNAPLAQPIDYTGKISEGAEKGADIANKMTEQKAIEAETAKKQTEIPKIEAETKNIGATQENTEADTKLRKFQGDLNEKIGLDDMMWNWEAAKDKLGAESSIATLNADALRAAIEGDPNNPSQKDSMVKAIQAGYKKTIIELGIAKTQSDTAKAEKTIKQFEATMTDNGIAPNSPWYVKLMGDILDQHGLNPIKKK